MTSSKNTTTSINIEELAALYYKELTAGLRRDEMADILEDDTMANISHLISQAERLAEQAGLYLDCESIYEAERFRFHSALVDQHENFCLK